MQKRSIKEKKYITLHGRKRIGIYIRRKLKKRVNEVNGKITEIMRKMSDIMLDAAKISVPKKKVNKK